MKGRLEAKGHCVVESQHLPITVCGFAMAAKGETNY